MIAVTLVAISTGFTLARDLTFIATAPENARVSRPSRGLLYTVTHDLLSDDGRFLFVSGCRYDTETGRRLDLRASFGFNQQGDSWSLYLTRADKLPLPSAPMNHYELFRSVDGTTALAFMDNPASSGDWAIGYAGIEINAGAKGIAGLRVDGPSYRTELGRSLFPSADDDACAVGAWDGKRWQVSELRLDLTVARTWKTADGIVDVALKAREALGRGAVKNSNGPDRYGWLLIDTKSATPVRRPLPPLAVDKLVTVAFSRGGGVLGICAGAIYRLDRRRWNWVSVMKGCLMAQSANRRWILVSDESLRMRLYRCDFD